MVRETRKQRWWRKELFKIIQKKPLGRNYFVDNSGRHWISQNIYPILDIGFLYEYILDIQQVTVAGASWQIALRPPKGEKYRIHKITVEQNGVTNELMDSFIEDNTGPTAQLINMFDETELQIPASSIETPIFPSWHATVGDDESHETGFQPLIIDNLHHFVMRNEGVWTNGTTVIGRILYWRVL